MALMNFHTHQSTCCPDSLCGQWQKLLDSSAREWQGPGSIAPQTVSSGQSCRLQPQSICVYSKQKRKSP
jgi:hypothetical protein